MSSLHHCQDYEESLEHRRSSRTVTPLDPPTTTSGAAADEASDSSWVSRLTSSSQASSTRPAASLQVVMDRPLNYDNVVRIPTAPATVAATSPAALSPATVAVSTAALAATGAPQESDQGPVPNWHSSPDGVLAEESISNLSLSPQDLDEAVLVKLRMDEDEEDCNGSLLSGKGGGHKGHEILPAVTDFEEDEVDIAFSNENQFVAGAVAVATTGLSSLTFLCDDEYPSGHFVHRMGDDGDENDYENDHNNVVDDGEEEQKRQLEELQPQQLDNYEECPFLLDEIVPRVIYQSSTVGGTVPATGREASEPEKEPSSLKGICVEEKEREETTAAATLTQSRGNNRVTASTLGQPGWGLYRTAWISIGLILVLVLGTTTKTASPWFNAFWDPIRSSNVGLHWVHLVSNNDDGSRKTTVRSWFNDKLWQPVLWRAGLDGVPFPDDDALTATSSSWFYSMWEQVRTCVLDWLPLLPSNEDDYYHVKSPSDLLGVIDSNDNAVDHVENHHLQDCDSHSQDGGQEDCIDYSDRHAHIGLSGNFLEHNYKKNISQHDQDEQEEEEEGRQEEFDLDEMGFDWIPFWEVTLLENPTKNPDLNQSTAMVLLENSLRDKMPSLATTSFSFVSFLFGHSTDPVSVVFLAPLVVFLLAILFVSVAMEWQYRKNVPKEFVATSDNSWCDITTMTMMMKPSPHPSLNPMEIKTGATITATSSANDVKSSSPTASSSECRCVGTECRCVTSLTIFESLLQFHQLFQPSGTGRITSGLREKLRGGNDMNDNLPDQGGTVFPESYCKLTMAELKLLISRLDPTLSGPGQLSTKSKAMRVAMLYENYANALESFTKAQLLQLLELKSQTRSDGESFMTMMKGAKKSELVAAALEAGFGTTKPSTVPAQ